MDGMLRQLREAGCSAGLIDVAYHTRQNHSTGHALQASRFPFDADDLPALSARCLEGWPSAEYPDLTAHIRHHTDAPTGEVSSSEFGSDTILDGLAWAREGA